MFNCRAVWLQIVAASDVNRRQCFHPRHDPKTNFYLASKPGRAGGGHDVTLWKITFNSIFDAETACAVLITAAIAILQ